MGKSIGELREKGGNNVYSISRPMLASVLCTKRDLHITRKRWNLHGFDPHWTYITHTLKHYALLDYEPNNEIAYVQSGRYVSKHNTLTVCHVKGYYMYLSKSIRKVLTYPLTVTIPTVPLNWGKGRDGIGVNTTDTYELTYFHCTHPLCYQWTGERRAQPYDRPGSWCTWYAGVSPSPLAAKHDDKDEEKS